MGKLEQFRDPELSLWQSAVDEVVAKRKAGSQVQGLGEPAAVTRPDTSDAMIHAAISDAKAADEVREKGVEPPAPPLQAPDAATLGVGETIAYCSNLARNWALAKFRGDHEAEEQYGNQLFGKFTGCDPGWAETAIRYAEFLASRGKVPYRVHKKMEDFVIDGKLPEKARVAIVGDWGTGQADARQVLAQIARKNPQVVIHLGDIYYSATAFEVDAYFYKIWRSILDLSKTQTYTLSGNHDMFSGGGPYYNLIDKLGQPASYFCLRNDHWQFLAMDTGLHDMKPGGTDPTYLEDTEVQWLTDKVQNSGGRRTVLVSHHQLFAAFEDICGKPVNERLHGQLAPLLPSVAVWFWGHEHNLVIYKKYLNVLGRCVGHGAFPVGPKEIPAKPVHPEVPVDDIRLDQGDFFFNHGYAIMDLDGASATVSYYQNTDEDNALFTETLASASSVAP